MKVILAILLLCSTAFAGEMTYNEFRFVVGKMIKQANGLGWKGKEFKQKYYSEPQLFELYQIFETYSEFYDIDDKWILANAIQQSKMKYDAKGDHVNGHPKSLGIFQIHCPTNGVYKCRGKKRNLLFVPVVNARAFMIWATIRKTKCLKKMTPQCKRAKIMMGEPIKFGSIKPTSRKYKKIKALLNLYRSRRNHDISGLNRRLLDGSGNENVG